MRLCVCALGALWVLDVQVNLALLPGVFFPDLLAARARDFLAILVLSSQVALGAALAALLVGALIAIATKRGVATESVAPLAAMLSALQVLTQANTVWGLGGAEMGRAVVFAAAAAVVVWAVLRLVSGLAFVDRWSLAEIARFTLFPPLVVGFLNLGLANMGRGNPRFGLLHAVIALSWVAAAWIYSRSRSQAVRALAIASPLTVALLVAAWACAAFAQVGRAPATAERKPDDDRPHVVLVVLDTVRADRLKLFGHERDTMPALERWSEGALVAMRAVSPAGWTAPAHASIFSGRTVSSHGVHFGERSFVTPPLDGIRWLPELLGERGYRTLAVAANPLALPEGVDDFGFDEVVAPRRNEWHASTIAALIDHRSPLLRVVSERFRWRMPYVDAGGIVDLVRKVAPTGDGPVFVLINFMEAHSPYNPPASALGALGLRPGRAFERYRSHRELTAAWSALGETKSSDLADLYDGELRGLDFQIEKLLRWLDERYGGEAVVIVTSDHGEELGEEGRVGHEHGLSQRLLHVPLMIRGPGIPVGERDAVADLRGLHDFVLSIADGGPPEVTALFEPREPGVVAERYPSGFAGGPRRPSVSWIDGERKAVGPTSHGFETFDLRRGFADDPLAGDDATDLRERIDDYWERHRDRRGDEGALSEAERTRLRSLGYVN